MQKSFVKRRATQAALMAAACAVTSISMGVPLAQAQAQSAGDLAIISGGGTYQDAQREAYFRPFSEETGVRVREDSGVTVERMRAEVMSGNPQVDVAAANQTTYQLGLNAGLWEEVDYGSFDQIDLDAMDPSVKTDHGVGIIYYSDGMAFNTDAFPASGPQPVTWTDFWDVEKFPGKRGLAKCSFPTFMLPEVANIAMGASKDNVYDIDIEAAASKLAELKDHVIWWDNPAQAVQLLATGEVAMALAPTGRAQLLVDSGAPVQVVWEGARRSFDNWVVLSGSQNKENAMKFLAFATRPEVQAKMAELSNYAPTNPRAMPFISDDVAKKLVSYPENFEKTFLKNDAWWDEHLSEWIEACEYAILQ